MKKLMCSDLGGPSECAVEITGNSFEEVGSNCKAHVMEEIGKGDDAHQAAVESMQGASPEDQQAMFAEYKQKYDNAPEV